MLLNILRTDGSDPQQLMRLSYRQFQTERALPTLEARVHQLEVGMLGDWQRVLSFRQCY